MPTITKSNWLIKEQIFNQFYNPHPLSETEYGVFFSSQTASVKRKQYIKIIYFYICLISLFIHLLSFSSFLLLLTQEPLKVESYKMSMLKVDSGSPQIGRVKIVVIRKMSSQVSFSQSMFWGVKKHWTFLPMEYEQNGNDSTLYMRPGRSQQWRSELVDLRNVYLIRTFTMEIAIGLWHFICEERSCRLKNNSSPKRTFICFWTSSRLESEDWGAPSQLW